jgi:hypothetical protein
MTRSHAQRGQVLPFVAICFTVLLGFTALAVDVGYLRFEQRMQQSAADSAALAGALELSVGSTTFASSAQNEAANNGYTNDGVNTIVTVNNPPASGPNTGNQNSVEVLVQVNHPTFFSGVLGRDTNVVTTRSVASVVGDTRACYYVLSGPATIGGTTVNAPTCGLIADNGFTEGGANINLASIDVHGTITLNAGVLTHQPQQSLPAADPCMSIPGCRYLTNNPPTGPCTYPGGKIVSSNITLQPGVYCNGLDIRSSTITLSPGVYVLPSIKTSGATITQTSLSPGDGVTLYITSGEVDLTGATGTITAPATGSTAGVSIYQVASDTTVAKVAGAIFGPSGLLYFPTAGVTLNGNYGVQQMVIAGSLTIGGAINNDPGFTGQNALVRTAVLSE